ncbi:hypothetical protein GQX74_000254 [Glossina fuscipes]|nr:hypothetical protein GQX74_000254 [Glossina fuscipes]
MKRKDLNDSLETVDQKQENQLNYFALNGKWKKATTDITAFPVNPNLVRESTSDITKPTLFPNIIAALKEKREICPTAEVLSAQSVLTKRKSKMQRNVDRRDENDADIPTEKREKVEPFHYAFRNDSVCSKTPSLQSFQRALEKSTFNTSSSMQSLRELGTFSLLEDEDALFSCDLNASEHLNYVSDLNIIMLLGLFIGLLISKALQCLQSYFGWSLYQVLQLRNAFLGTTTIWEFLNPDHKTRLRVRTKLLLMPIIGVCSLLYGLITILNCFIRFLLTAAPNGLKNFSFFYCDYSLGIPHMSTIQCTHGDVMIQYALVIM